MEQVGEYLAMRRAVWASRTRIGPGTWANSLKKKKKKTLSSKGCFELEKFHKYMIVPPKHSPSKGVFVF